MPRPVQPLLMRTAVQLFFLMLFFLMLGIIATAYAAPGAHTKACSTRCDERVFLDSVVMEHCGPYKKKSKRTAAACMQGMRRGLHAGCRIACNEGTDDNCPKAGERASRTCKNFRKFSNNLVRLCMDTYVAVAESECRSSAAYYETLITEADKIERLAAERAVDDEDAEMLAEEERWVQLHGDEL